MTGVHTLDLNWRSGRLRGHTGWVQKFHSATHTQGCLRQTGRMPLLIWWNSTSCRRSMKSVRPSSMVKYFLPPSSHCRDEDNQSSCMKKALSCPERMRFLQGMKGTHRDHQVMFGLQLVTHREDEALHVLLALTNQKHPTTYTHKNTQGGTTQKCCDPHCSVYSDR